MTRITAKRSRWQIVLSITFGLIAAVLLMYVAAFCLVRHTHTKTLSYHENGSGYSYDCTFFDEYEAMDGYLYVMFYPALEADRRLTGRSYDKDKW